MGTAAALTLLVPTLLLVVTVTAAVTVAGDAAVTEPSSIGPVLVAGEGGYASFRIPGIVATGGGRCGKPGLVLVAEGRRYGCDDFDGQHDIVAKRSTDGGRRWGALQVVADPAKQFNCTLGSLILPRCEFWDPTIVYDAESCETIIMSAYASANSSTRGGGHQDIFVLRSSDSGASWSAPNNISTMLSATKGASYHVSTGNGHGMQIKAPSPWAGRLLVPAYGVVPTFQAASGPWGSSVYFSDDHGYSWKKGKDFAPGSAEGEIVQIPGHPRGDLLANLRNINANGSVGCGELSNGMCRVTARSTDGGVTWGDVMTQPSQRDPSCKAGLVAWPPVNPTVILLANADNNATRTNITLRISADQGRTYPADRVNQVFPGPALAGYVDVAATEEGAVVAFENATCSISVAVVALGANGTVPTFRCFNGTCIEATAGRGRGLSECQDACVPAGGGAYKCVGGLCVLDPGGVSKSDCAAMCVPGA